MIKDLKAKIKSLDCSIQELKNERSSINEQYVKELYEECQKNIERCFKNEDGYYYTILKTSDIKYDYLGISFNEFKYEALCFKYPYDGSKMPYENKAVYINHITNDDSYEEIKFDEFISKLSEVNESWLSSLKNN